MTKVGRELGQGTGKGWGSSERWARFTRIREVKPLCPETALGHRSG